MQKRYRYLFGPVPSRRLGQSLGIDLTPFKACSFDCIFCQLGRTTRRTVERSHYIPVEAVRAELKEWLQDGGRADAITLSGSGEPTLHAGFGDILDAIRDLSAIPAVLLTNGSLLAWPDVRAAARRADIVKVSLSAWDQASYENVNRPHPDLRFEGLIEGLQRYRDAFSGRLWMEVFLIAGINTRPEDVARIAEFAAGIAPDRIQLNTAVRPPAENFVRPLSNEQLIPLTGLFRPEAEIIAEFSGGTSRVRVNQDTILAMLQRRPCTARQIADVFDLHLNEVSKYIGKLLRTGVIRSDTRDGGVYYLAMGNAATGHSDQKGNEKSSHWGA